MDHGEKCEFHAGWGLWPLPVFLGGWRTEEEVFFCRGQKGKQWEPTPKKSKETPFFAETLKFEGIRKISNQFDLRNL